MTRVHPPLHQSVSTFVDSSFHEEYITLCEFMDTTDNVLKPVQKLPPWPRLRIILKHVAKLNAYGAILACLLVLLAYLTSLLPLTIFVDGRPMNHSLTSFLMMRVLWQLLVVGWIFSTYSLTVKFSSYKRPVATTAGLLLFLMTYDSVMYVVDSPTLPGRSLYQSSSLTRIPIFLSFFLYMGGLSYITKRWEKIRGVFLHLFLPPSIALILLYGYYFFVLPIYFSPLTSNVTKSVVRLLVHPFVQECGTGMLRYAFSTSRSKTHAAIPTFFWICTYSIVGRFMIFSNDVGMSIFLSCLSSLQEIATRLTRIPRVVYTARLLAWLCVPILNEYATNLRASQNDIELHIELFGSSKAQVR